MELRNASASAFALLCSERSLLGVYRNHKAFQKVTVRKFLDDVVYPTCWKLNSEKQRLVEKMVQDDRRA